jgi:hypothetical protein
MRKVKVLSEMKNKGASPEDLIVSIKVSGAVSKRILSKKIIVANVI